MSLPRYPEYKDSGVEWLGKVPAHWKVMRFSRAIAAIKDGTHGTYPRVIHGLPLLSAKNVQNNGIELSDAESLISEADHQEIVANGFPAEGDVLLTIVGTIGRSCVYQGAHPIAFQRSVCFLRLSSPFVPKFFHYLIQSKFFQEQLIGRSKSSAQAGVYMGDVVATSVLCPVNSSEQAAVAEFLDHETARIDALIAEQEKLLALLAEKRQATISHAVARGLDPNVPMKDSGIAWLGEVPAHWKVLSIKQCSPVQRGASPRPIDDPKYFDDDGDYAWVRISDVSSSGGLLESTDQRLSELGASLSVKLDPGSLFISIAGSVGKPCITKINACIHDGFVYFPNLKIPPMFLFRIFEAGACYAGLGKMGTQLNLNTDTVGAIQIAVPPDSELNDILRFLEEKLSDLDVLASHARAAASLLNERRSALISAAVTGQIDVRGLVDRDAA